MSTRMGSDTFRAAMGLDKRPVVSQVLGRPVRVTKPKPVRPLEAKVESEIIDELKRLGYWVFRTGQKNAQRSGVTPGTPDLYVWRPGWGCRHCPLEVKRDEQEARRKSRRGDRKKIGTSAQHHLIEAGGVFVVWSVETALSAVRRFEKENGLEGK